MCCRFMCSFGGNAWQRLKSTLINMQRGGIESFGNIGARRLKVQSTSLSAFTSKPSVRNLKNDGSAPRKEAHQHTTLDFVLDIATWQKRDLSGNSGGAAESPNQPDWTKMMSPEALFSGLETFKMRFQRLWWALLWTVKSCKRHGNSLDGGKSGVVFSLGSRWIESCYELLVDLVGFWRGLFHPFSTTSTEGPSIILSFSGTCFCLVACSSQT